MQCIQVLGGEVFDRGKSKMVEAFLWEVVRFGLTVLGSIEEVRDKNSKIETCIVDNPLSPLAESYRMIRSSLLLSQNYIL